MTKSAGASRARKAKPGAKPPWDAVFSDWTALDENTEYDFGARLWGDPVGSTYSLSRLREELARSVDVALRDVRSVGGARDDSPAPGHLIPLRRGLHALADRATRIASTAQDQLAEYLRALVDLTGDAWEALQRGDLAARDHRTGRRLAAPTGKPGQFVAIQFLGKLPSGAAPDAKRHAAILVSRPPIFDVVDALRHNVARDAHWFDIYVARSEFVDWAVTAGLATRAELDLDRVLDDDTPAVPPVLGTKIEKRIEFILTALREANFDPLNLPQSKQRDSKSPKNIARERADRRPVLFDGRTAFDNAWSEAQSKGRIRVK